jgi:succinyl-CoA synthetase beta subunit
LVGAGVQENVFPLARSTSAAGDSLNGSARLMLPLPEHRTKAELLARRLPVPAGERADSAEEARRCAAALGSAVAVKALVPAGRRGKAGAVRMCDSPDECAAAAAAMIGTSLAGQPVRAVYVEQRIEITTELYLAFSLTGGRLKILLSAAGGVDIEETFRRLPSAVVTDTVDPLVGLTPWHAIGLWVQAGVRGQVLRPLGDLTVAIFDAFRATDALTLEINPLAVMPDGKLCLVGAMMAVDQQALFRHTQWRDALITEQVAANEREQRVRVANATLPGGEAQYSELDGDIGLLVGGGGAGLYLHDMIVDLGGRPANHCVTPPTGSDTRKLRAVLEAILDNPRVRSLLVGFNFAQMVRADLRMTVVAELLRERAIDTASFPIVVRLFGAGEAEARELASSFPGLTYLPHGATLRDAAVEIVHRSAAAREKGAI